VTCTHAHSRAGPCVAAAAAAAAADLVVWCSRRAQSIVINGGSGSGKTYVRRQLLGQWCALCRSSRSEQLLHANHVMEQFTHATTTQTNDSSRSAAVVRLHYSDGGRLVGWRFGALPLDVARVSAPPASERSYHLCDISMLIESLDWLRLTYVSEIESTYSYHGAGTT
jgi:myosin heavy subunit